MAKAKKGTKENPVTQEDLAAIAEPKKRAYSITEAHIKDDLCNYKYDLLVAPFDDLAVKGKGLILEDMREVFRLFRVHLASIDGAFKRNGLEVEDIDMHHNDDITGAYHVNGFKIRGSEESESIILIGSKYIAEAGGRMELETPKIDISNLSSYKWYNELKELADNAREEVALYKEGKYQAVEEEDEEDDEEAKPRKRRARQLTIASPEATADQPETNIDDEDADDDFNDAKL